MSHGVVRFSLAVDSPNYLFSEAELLCDRGKEDIHILSNSGSEVDCAALESSFNPLAVM
jgi:hypothetical protein